MKLQTFVVFIRLITGLALLRPFGSIINDVVHNSNGQLDLCDLRKLEKLRIKLRKAELDLNFLKNCQTLGVTPKFLAYNLPHTSRLDGHVIRKRLLRSAIHKRNGELSKFRKELNTVDTKIRSIVSSLEYYTVSRAIAVNVAKQSASVIKTHEKKLHALTHNHVLPFAVKDTIQNFSSYSPSEEELDLLKHGLTFGIAPPKLKRTDICASFEMMSRAMVDDLKDAGKAGELRSQLSALANNYYHSYKPTTAQLKKHRIMEKLRKNKDIVILKPDKGNAVVILDRQLYVERMLELISDRSKFVELDEDPTRVREGSIQRHLRKLKKSGLFGHSKEDIAPKYRRVYPQGSRPARLYGLPKMHKFVTNNASDIPFRPILSALGTASYNTAKYLDEILQPLIPTDYSCKDTFAFLEDLKSVSPQIANKHMVSFDVTSLFTNIPLDETLDLAVDLIMTNRPDLKCSKPDLKKLFLHATSKTHFLFNGKYYDQIDGVTMGSPLGPTLANLFMGHHERRWLDEFAELNGNILFYRRYVDDIFAVFDSESDAMIFLDFLNKQHPCIKFTYESNIDNFLPFLDVHISNANKVTTTLFRKKTYTGLLTNFLSYTAENYKIGLIKNLLYRAFAINNSWNGFHAEIVRIKKILQQNSFPAHIVDHNIKTFLDNVHKTPIGHNNSSNGEKMNRYFKLPFRGKHSGIVRKKTYGIV